MKPLAPRQRWAILALLLVATVAAAMLVEDETEVPATVVNVPRAVPSVAAAGPSSVAAGEAGTADGEADETDHIDPFRGKSWYVVPPPPPPAKPKAPPLPFRYLGQMAEDGEARIFVDHQGRHLILRAGDVVNGTYAVEEIAAGRVVFTYLPLKEKQILVTGSL